ncbi:class I adenylate-forming enzyme family protein [Candidatus Poriferisocius sp.]|uniref:class I adenylate-forming enzyme family protein n=1 Tax=Candidatus Poriferisocius sp. TaxID=3101276 RepID=UPI003B0245E0
MNVGLAFARNGARHPREVALFGDRELTNRQLDERTNRIANALLGAHRLGRGDRVALMVANRPEVVEVMGGITKAGGCYVGLNFRLGPVELEQVFDNADPVLAITDSEHREQLSGFDLPIIDIDRDLDPLAEEGSAAPPDTLHQVGPSDDFCIVYTSGTTGRPKGVHFDHARVLQHAAVACLEYEIDRHSRYLIQIPHNSSVNITILPCLLVGAAQGFVDSRHFDPVRYARLVEEHGVSHSFLVPTQLMRLLDHLEPADDHRLGSLLTLGYGSSPISPDRLAELVERFGPVFNQLYGMAEIASIGTILRKEDHVRGLEERPELLSSCGQPSYAVDVRVVDPDGRDVGVGERGEVIFAGPHVMKGYFRDPVRTAESLRNGWMHSGDVAEIDHEGFIHIVDRMKNLIIRGGLNIAPTEIENVLYRHPAVLEASVIGVPDAEWGEAIVAVVALKQGAVVGDQELQRWCRQSELTSIKVPERVEFTDSLPKNAVGKIAKQELRARYWGEGRRV